MPAGPTALVVALLLLPGWIFTRVEGLPRMSRSAVEEVLHLIACSLATAGVAVLAYVTVTEQFDTPLTQVTALTRKGLTDSPTRAAWSATILVVTSCVIAGLVGWAVKGRRGRRADDETTYHPEAALWASFFPGVHGTVVDVQMRDGRLISGYFVGHDVTDERTPDLHIQEPRVTNPPSRSLRQRTAKAESQAYPGGQMMLIGTEIVSVMIREPERAGSPEN